MTLDEIINIIKSEKCFDNSEKCYGVNAEHCSILDNLIEKVTNAYL